MCQYVFLSDVLFVFVLLHASVNGRPMSILSIYAISVSDKCISDTGACII